MRQVLLPTKLGAACAALLWISLLVLSACTTTQEIRRPDGSREYLIACGASTGWNICYARANELCPDGYNTLVERPGFNRKEMRISCPANGAATQSGAPR